MQGAWIAKFLSNLSSSCLRLFAIHMPFYTTRQINRSKSGSRPPGLLAYRVRFAGLPLQGVLLILIVLMVVPRLTAMCCVLVDMLHVLVNRLFIHFSEYLKSILDVRDEGVASRPGEVFPHHAHHLQPLTVRRHGVCGYNPATLSKVVRDSELVIMSLLLGVQTKRYQWKTLTTLFAHDDEAEL